MSDLGDGSRKNYDVDWNEQSVGGVYAYVFYTYNLPDSLTYNEYFLILHH